MFGLAWKRTRRVTTVDEWVFWAAGFWPAASVTAASSVAVSLTSGRSDVVEPALAADSCEVCLLGDGQTAATGITIFCDDDVWRVMTDVDGLAPSDVWLADNSVHDAVITPSSATAASLADELIAQIVLQLRDDNKSVDNISHSYCSNSTVASLPPDSVTHCYCWNDDEMMINMEKIAEI